MMIWTLTVMIAYDDDIDNDNNVAHVTLVYSY